MISSSDQDFLQLTAYAWGEFEKDSHLAAMWERDLARSYVPIVREALAADFSDEVMSTWVDEAKTLLDETLSDIRRNKTFSDEVKLAIDLKQKLQEMRESVAPALDHGIQATAMELAALTLSAWMRRFQEALESSSAVRLTASYLPDDSQKKSVIETIDLGALVSSAEKFESAAVSFWNSMRDAAHRDGRAIELTNAMFLHAHGSTGATLATTSAIRASDPVETIAQVRANTSSTYLDALTPMAEMLMGGSQIPEPLARPFYEAYRGSAVTVAPKMRRPQASNFMKLVALHSNYPHHSKIAENLRGSRSLIITEMQEGAKKMKAPFEVIVAVNILSVAAITSDGGMRLRGKNMVKRVVEAIHQIYNVKPHTAKQIVRDSFGRYLGR